MKVLVIPEDPTLDQYILKPVVERLFSDLGKTARVQVLSKPRLRGIAQALDPTIIADVVQTYPMVDLFLVMVDRDGDPKRPGARSARNPIPRNASPIRSSPSERPSSIRVRGAPGPCANSAGSGKGSWARARNSTNSSSESTGGWRTSTPDGFPTTCSIDRPLPWPRAHGPWWPRAPG